MSVNTVYKVLYKVIYYYIIFVRIDFVELFNFDIYYRTGKSLIMHDIDLV